MANAPQRGGEASANEREAAEHMECEPECYEIRIKGRLDAARWADRFEGLSFAYESDGTTLLSGPVADQAALHGFLRSVRDLGLTLISLRADNDRHQKEEGTNL